MSKVESMFGQDKIGSCRVGPSRLSQVKFMSGEVGSGID